jgi:hypothetical protein
MALEENYRECIDCKDQANKIITADHKVREPVVLMERLRQLPLHLEELDQLEE